MRVVLQRVSRGAVTTEEEGRVEIGRGLVILAGVEQEDAEEDISWLVERVLRLKLFEGEAGRMSLDISEIEGEILAISQFTLHASVKKGRKASFHRAAEAETAKKIFDLFVATLKQSLGEHRVKKGVFGAMMSVEIVNEGPVTLLLDSKKRE